MKCISLLGSTGSIGVSVLDVVRQFSDRYRIGGLAAGTNVKLLASQVIEFDPEVISVLDETRAFELEELLPSKYHDRIYTGVEGNKLVATFDESEITLSAIVGGAGLLPTLAAIEAGKDIGLANKETLVMAGRIVMAAAEKENINLLPVDSEHSAIFQALEAGRKEDLEKIILTASGGPFRGRTLDDLMHVTPAEALAHPNWSMGKKISIDSATLMNKGLEVIEARWLFEVPTESIDVVVHPQSIVHSLVEYRDGSVLAQLGIPDMKIPIAYALSYPERMELGLTPLRLSECGQLDFLEPDYTCFPALKLAFEAIKTGGVLPAVLNAANEIAVEAFLKKRISFLQIAETVQRTMDIVDEGSDASLADILSADERSRVEAEAIIQRFGSI